MTAARQAVRAATMLVEIGALDAASTVQARELLRAASQQAPVDLFVDLTRLDDGHELTMFALLSECSRSLKRNGGTLIAIRPPARLAGYLLSTAIPVAQQPPDGSAPVVVLTVGCGERRADYRFGRRCQN